MKNLKQFQNKLELLLEKAKDVTCYFDAIKEVKYDDGLLKIAVNVEGVEVFFDYNDVLNFYRRYSNDFTSTIRKFGEVFGDWRPITRLASYIKEVFETLKEAQIPVWIEEEANEEDNTS